MSQPTRPAWTLTEAADRTEASRSTLRRYRESGRFPHAYKDPAGQWRFPIEDLLAAGIKLTRAAQDEHVSAPAGQAPEQPTDALRERVAELERELAVQQALNAALERLTAAAEANAQDLRMALRMLGPAPQPAAAEQPPRSDPGQVSTPTGQAHEHGNGQPVSGRPPGSAGRALGRLLSRLTRT